MKYKHILYFSLLNNLIPTLTYYNKKNIENLAFVKAPVIDVIGRSLLKIDKNINTKNFYNSLEYAPENGKYACLRLHQLLFNEVVKIKKENKYEYECELESLYYFDNKNNIRKSFWVEKENLIKLKYIKNLEAIPEPYKVGNQVYKKNILTLIGPWNDNITKKVYSAGTRFLRQKDKDKSNYYAISILDNNLSKRISYVPKNLAIINYPNKKNAGKLLVKLVKSFIGDNKKIIPYLWGGCSYTNKIDNNKFYLKKTNNLGENAKVWSRQNILKKPLTGFECSSLILRAAQILGLPYFSKNTTAISKTLRPLSFPEKIEEGDLLWYPGHVLLISDLNKNKIIESVGYSLGYGKLHEIDLNKVFKNIDNYNILLNKYLAKQKLSRLNISGKIYKSINKFLILKFNSIFEKNQ